MSIETQIDAVDKRVHVSLNKAFKQMERKLLALYSKLKYDDEDLLVRDVANVNKANSLLTAMNKEMAPEFKRVYDAEIAALKKMTKIILEESGDLGLPKSLLAVTKAEAKTYMEGISGQLKTAFEGALDEANTLVRGSISGTLDFVESTKALSAKLDIRLHQAETLASTGLMNFQRTIMTTQADEAGVDWYAYLGPDDSKTRLFCDHVVDKRYTLPQLESLSGSFGRSPNLVPVSMWLGGYNCRHRLVPLVDDEDIKRYKKGPTGRKG